jgi:hypothetical protein
MSDKSSSSAGVGFTGLLTVAFVVLKLCHVINWSWWWVLSPLWIGFLVFLAVIAVIVIVAVIAHVFSRPGPRRRF